jgi:hypothetical protein
MTYSGGKHSALFVVSLACVPIAGCGDDDGERALSCDARVDAAQNAAKESLESLAAGETNCGADEDCALVPDWGDSTRCTRLCMRPEPINVTAAERVLERYAEIDRTYCQDFGYENQPCFPQAAASTTCAQTYFSRCTNGTCEAVLER